MTIGIYLAGVFYPEEVEIAGLLSNARLYDGKMVKVHGFLVKNTGLFWGEVYDLYAVDPIQVEKTVCVALTTKSEILERYVLYTWDGVEFTRIRENVYPAGSILVVEGIFHDQGMVVDAPQYYIDVSKAYLSEGI